MTFFHPLSVNSLQSVHHCFGILMQSLAHIKKSRGRIQLCRSTSYLTFSPPLKKITMYLHKGLGPGARNWIVFLCGWGL